MKSNAQQIINEILGWTWNFALWGTIAYYVFERGESGWWFLLALVATASGRKHEKEVG